MRDNQQYERAWARKNVRNGHEPECDWARTEENIAQIKGLVHSSRTMVINGECGTCGPIVRPFA